MAEVDALLTLGIDARPAKAGAEEIVSATKTIVRGAKDAERAVVSLGRSGSSIGRPIGQFVGSGLRGSSAGPGASVFGGGSGLPTAEFKKLREESLKTVQAQDAVAASMGKTAQSAAILKLGLQQLGVPVQLLSVGKAGFAGLASAVALVGAEFAALALGKEGLTQVFQEAKAAVDDLAGGFFTAGKRAREMREQADAFFKASRSGSFLEFKLPGGEKTGSVDVTGLDERGLNKVERGIGEFSSGTRTLGSLQKLAAVERERVNLAKERSALLQDEADRINGLLAAGRKSADQAKEELAARIAMSKRVQEIDAQWREDDRQTRVAEVMARQVELIAKKARQELIYQEMVDRALEAQNKLVAKERERLSLIEQRTQAEEFQRGEIFLTGEVNKIKAAEKVKADAEARARQKIEEDALVNERFADDVGFRLAAGFEEAVLSGNKLRDVLRNLALDLQQIVFRNLVTQPLGNFLSGIAGTVLPTVPGTGGGNTNIPPPYGPFEGGGGGSGNIWNGGITSGDSGFRRSRRQNTETLRRGGLS